MNKPALDRSTTATSILIWWSAHGANYKPVYSIIVWLVSMQCSTGRCTKMYMYAWDKWRLLLTWLHAFISPWTIAVDWILFYHDWWTPTINTWKMDMLLNNSVKNGESRDASVRGVCYRNVASNVADLCRKLIQLGPSSVVSISYYGYVGLECSEFKKSLGAH